MTYTAQQIKNLEFAANVVWPSVPPENVFPRLVAYTLGGHNRTDCEVVACGGGWLCRHPFFQDQGVCITDTGRPDWVGAGEPLGIPGELFGDPLLFAVRGLHPADAIALGATDHEVFANRLRWNLERAKV